MSENLPAKIVYFEVLEGLELYEANRRCDKAKNVTPGVVPEPNKQGYERRWVFPEMWGSEIFRLGVYDAD